MRDDTSRRGTGRPDDDAATTMIRSAPIGLERVEAAASYLRSRVSARTWSAYASDLAHAEREMPGIVDAACDPDGAARTRELAAAWVAAMRERGLSAATIQRRVTALRSLVEAALDLGLVHESLRVRVPRRGPGVGRMPAPWTALERVGLDLDSSAAAEHDGSAVAARDAAIWWLALDSALRRGEIAAIQRQDVVTADPLPHVRTLRKGAHGRAVVPISGRAAAALERWQLYRGNAPGPAWTTPRHAPGRPSSGLTAATIGRIIARRAAAKGLAVTAHDLRRASITRAMRVTRDADLTRRHAGHRSLATTTRYVHASPEEVAAVVRAVAGELGQQLLPGADGELQGGGEAAAVERGA